MARPTIADTAVELLAAAPALTTDEIAAVVLERGQTRARDPRAAVQAALDANVRLLRLHDGRWVAPLHRLDGAVLTHVLTPQEAAADALEMSADLAPLWRLALAKVPLKQGGHLTPAFLDGATRRLGPGVDRAIVGPPGWLPTTPGTLLHLRLSGGILSVAGGAPPRSTARMAERRLVIRTRQGLEEDLPRFPKDEGIADIAHVVLQALVEAPGLLDEPLAPLGDVFRGAGLEVHETEVGLQGTDWTGRSWSGVDDDSPDEEDEDGYDLDDELGELREGYELSDLEVETLRLFLVSLSLEETRAPIDDEETLGRLSLLLEQPLIAEIVADRAWYEPGVRTLAERILSVADTDAQSGVRYLLGVAAEAGEQPEAAEALLRASLVQGPGFAPSLIALARIVVDRGRYAEALELLKRADVPADDAERSFLEWVLRPAGGRVGRNDPCPCGSGRKSKQCHPGGLGTVTLSPGERLIRKIQTWADRPENDERIHDLLSQMGIEEPHDEDGDAEHPAWWLAHTLAADILVFDRAELDRFLRVRGPLLPAEELALAETWRSTRRSLLEVRAIDPGMGVTVLDLVDGSVRHVSDERMSRELERMDLVCARLLPDGASGLISDDAFLVPPDGRARAMQLVKGGDGLALLAWLISPVGRDIIH